jgi:outer membrane cobalamin receptor
MKTILLALILTASLSMLGQTRISGTVRDEKDSSIPGANVFLLDTYDGTTTDLEGHFEFTSDESGPQFLVVKFVGYKEYKTAVELDGKDLVISIQLREEINQLEAVIITAGAFGASDESRRTIFKAVDIATTAGATADIAGALNTLPGTQKVGESGRLFVRGGDGNETRTFIDGMMVLDAYGTAAPYTPSRGRFMPFMFKGTSFSTGGYSAEYGQALSSALVLDSKDEEKQTRTDFGLLSVGGDVAHSQSWSNGSVAAKIQYTNIRPYFGLINQQIDWITPPASLEGSSAFRQKVGEGMIKVYGQFNQSDFSLYQHDIDDPSTKWRFNLGNKFGYANASYKTALSKKWYMRSGMSYTSTRNDIKVDAIQIDEVNRGIHTKVVFDGSVSDRIEIRTGGEIITHDYKTLVDTSTASLWFDEVITSLFGEADIYTSNKFVARAGLRSEFNSRTHQYSLDPRLSLALKSGEGQFSLAYGTFRQSPKYELLRYDDQLKDEKATHYILNYQLIQNKRTFRIEGYYKTYDDLVKVEQDGFTNQGDGYARGLEFFWRDNQTLRNTDYWISYSFLDTERNYLNAPYAVTPTFASTHNFSVVCKRFITAIKSQIGVTYSYSSGRPFNDPNSEKFNDGRTKSSQDLSLNVSYLPSSQLILYFSCTNILGRDNIFGYEYSGATDSDGLYERRAIRQAAPRFLFIGIFLTLSKHKSLNQLPSL